MVSRGARARGEEEKAGEYVRSTLPRKRHPSKKKTMTTKRRLLLLGARTFYVDDPVEYVTTVFFSFAYFSKLLCKLTRKPTYGSLYIYIVPYLSLSLSLSFCVSFPLNEIQTIRTFPAKTRSISFLFSLSLSNFSSSRGKRNSWINKDCEESGVLAGKHSSQDEDAARRRFMVNNLTLTTHKPTSPKPAKRHAAGLPSVKIFVRQETDHRR